MLKSRVLPDTLTAATSVSDVVTPLAPPQTKLAVAKSQDHSLSVSSEAIYHFRFFFMFHTRQVICAFDMLPHGLKAPYSAQCQV